MGLILTNLYVFAMALVLAILEIQIEGQHGWAKNLPTWRPHSGKWYVKAFSRLSGGKELTGYHAVLIAFLLLVFHLPYILGLKITIENWARALSYFLMFTALWDFLWFVLNPYYPIKKFKKEHISWHKKWLWFMPIDYYMALLLSLIMSALTGQIDWWLKNIALFLVETFVMILFTLYVLDIDNWHAKKTRS